MHPVKGERHRCLGGDDFLLRLLALFVDVLQLHGLGDDGSGQCRVALLGMNGYERTQRQCHDSHSFFN